MVFDNFKYNYLALKYLLYNEKNYKSGAKFSSKLKLLLSGFTSEKETLYNLNANNKKQYLSDFSRRKTQSINGDYQVILDDKNLFSTLLEKENIVPKVFGTIIEGKIQINDDYSDINDLILLLKKHNSLIMKKNEGGGGKGVYKVNYFDDRLSINGKNYNKQDFLDFISKLEDSIITEYLQQASYSSEIYPGTVNTIRILVMRDPESKEPFIATAIHKFGSSTTEPVDNVWNGGYTSLINLFTGKLGKAAHHEENNKKIIWVDEHKDTHAIIEGTQIPHWELVKNTILDLTNSLEYINYVGWDVVITENGCKIIEGNNFSDVNIFQIHQPLLIDEKVRSFYKYHSIIK